MKYPPPLTELRLLGSCLHHQGEIICVHRKISTRAAPVKPIWLITHLTSQCALNHMRHLESEFVLKLYAARSRSSLKEHYIFCWESKQWASMFSLEKKLPLFNGKTEKLMTISAESPDDVPVFDWTPQWGIIIPCLHIKHKMNNSITCFRPTWTNQVKLQRSSVLLQFLEISSLEGILMIWQFSGC